MKKILHIGQVIGGLDTYIRNIVENSNSDKFQFVIALGEQDEYKPFKGKNVSIKEYKIKLARNINLINDVICVFQILKIVKIEKPDIIHCHSAKGGFIGRIVGALTRKKTFYTPNAFSFLTAKNSIIKFIYLSLEKYLKFNTYLLACSESERQIGIKEVGYKPCNALVWKNAVNDIRSSSTFKNLNSDKFICFIGRPSFQKNVFFLVDVIADVCKKIPDFKIYLLGVGYHSPDLTLLKSKIEYNKLENNIILHPWVSQSEVLSYLNQSLYYLSVARYEGLPFSILEAMALSKPIIASNVVGNIDCVKNDYNGYVLPLDIQCFSSKIIELWNSQETREIFGQNSRKKYLEEFNLANQIKLLEDIYSEINPENKDNISARAGLQL